MIITRTVSFNLATEYMEDKEFRDLHPDWEVIESTGFRTYTKTTFYSKTEGDNNADKECACHMCGVRLCKDRWKVFILHEKEPHCL